MIVAGFILAMIAGVGFSIYQKVASPLGAITNLDFPLVQVSRYTPEGAPLFELRKGESKLLEYGEYAIAIPDIKASFVLFKNNRGTCDLHSADGVLLVEVNENATLLNVSKPYNKH
ncbi:MAG: hypothetical protein IAE97_06555 [Chthoniobacterales bacterium]|nr:hypothetical protein [Chthoniobacterales bacterium]